MCVVILAPARLQITQNAEAVFRSDLSGENRADLSLLWDGPDHDRPIRVRNIPSQN